MHITNLKVKGHIKRKKPLECGCIEFIIQFIDYNANVIFVRPTTSNIKCLMIHVEMFSIREEYFIFYEIVEEIVSTIKILI